MVASEQLFSKISPRSGGGACRVDARDDCLDVGGGLVDIGGSKAKLLGERSVAVRPFGEHSDARWSGVLGP
jgi:hypothetical protein